MTEALKMYCQREKCEQVSQVQGRGSTDQKYKEEEGRTHGRPKGEVLQGEAGGF